MPVTKNFSLRIEILDQLLSIGKKFTFGQLLERINEKLSEMGLSEISDRTLRNDIKFLRDEKDAPLFKATNAEPFYYYVNKFSIKELIISDEDVDYFKQAADILKKVAGLSFGAELDEIIKKKRQEKEQEERKKIYRIDYFPFKNNYDSYPITKKFTYDEYNKIKTNLDIYKKIEIYKYDKKIETILNKNYEKFIKDKKIERLKEEEKYEEEQRIRKENCIKEENIRLSKISNDKINVEEYDKINKERNDANLEFERKYNQRYSKYI